MVARSLSVVAIVLLSVIWVNAKAVDEQQFESEAHSLTDLEGLTAAGQREVRHDREPSNFEKKHVVMINDVITLKLNDPSKWQKDMTSRLSKSPANHRFNNSLIVVKDRHQRNQLMAERSALTPYDNFTTTKRYCVVEFQIQKTGNVVQVLRITVLGDVKVELGLDKKGLINHFNKIVHPGNGTCKVLKDNRIRTK
ncbi:uncharacterized protein LOC141910273 [Tubulanus polymorphus]|uniref:uncharacterized protein LOC141910273 n=1 Tax=Tubulanus polymorphus TaxID=672921 RepID=UPI003DA5D76D